jgi:hypothetical protein
VEEEEEIWVPGIMNDDEVPVDDEKATPDDMEVDENGGMNWNDNDEHGNDDDDCG